MDKLFEMEIVTPMKVLFKEKVKHARLPGIGGYFGILPSHEPFVTTLIPGEIKIDLENGKPRYFAVSGGIVEVLPAKMSVLVETAEEAHEIDVERALYAKERALRRISEEKDRLEIEKAKKSLERAVTRIRVAERLQRKE